MESLEIAAEFPLARADLLRMLRARSDRDARRWLKVIRRSCRRSSRYLRAVEQAALQLRDLAMIGECEAMWLLEVAHRSSEGFRFSRPQLDPEAERIGRMAQNIGLEERAAAMLSVSDSIEHEQRCKQGRTLILRMRTTAEVWGTEGALAEEIVVIGQHITAAAARRGEAGFAAAVEALYAVISDSVVQSALAAAHAACNSVILSQAECDGLVIRSVESHVTAAWRRDRVCARLADRMRHIESARERSRRKQRSRGMALQHETMPGRWAGLDERLAARKARVAAGVYRRVGEHELARLVAARSAEYEALEAAAWGEQGAAEQGAIEEPVKAIAAAKTAIMGILWASSSRETLWRLMKFAGRLDKSPELAEAAFTVVRELRDLGELSRDEAVCLFDVVATSLGGTGKTVGDCYRARVEAELAEQAANAEEYTASRQNGEQAIITTRIVPRGPSTAAVDEAAVATLSEVIRAWSAEGGEHTGEPWTRLAGVAAEVAAASPWSGLAAAERLEDEGVISEREAFDVSVCVLEAEVGAAQRLDRELGRIHQQLDEIEDQLGLEPGARFAGGAEPAGYSPLMAAMGERMNRVAAAVFRGYGLNSYANLGIEGLEESRAVREAMGG